MIFWQSSEATQDNYGLIAPFVHAVEKEINAHLTQATFTSKYQDWKWAFIAILLDHGDYPEMRKIHIKRKVLEFRLNVNIDLMTNLQEKERLEIYFKVLYSCFNADIVKKLDLPEQDLQQIYTALDTSLSHLLLKYEKNIPL